MKIYRLFREYGEKEIYGENPGDALLHCGSLRKTGKLDPGSQDYIPGDEVFISSIIGMVDTNNSKRGDDDYSCVVCEGVDGIRFSVDMKLIGTVQPIVEISND